MVELLCLEGDLLYELNLLGPINLMHLTGERLHPMGDLLRLIDLLCLIGEPLRLIGDLLRLLLGVKLLE